ncbi:threonine/serine dehydratase [Candidatus Bathyarchaeota archaeon]|jgi:threonine dehydratase|nr:threonine/serine dehydratase [Candidatus Bathyarchaeota archaeon]MBT4423114.1 threonine/serine dehydratase [Candidatus Bathyarchaeota archaeon]MBT5643430.1 threonine/serine dehydratase [Candidatus Bathyarchaeota archaeon]MBT6605490.1 threonine/serine dehydratase [Candidatus Bathyarchaeota archaeon]MBT7186140.1 threonine/serine dehydratase [Candidatus Bathyarchaeota archaeon]
MISLSEFYAARERVQKWARRTPMEYSPGLSKLIDGDVWLKLENQQVTGSFKIRGATNKILLLSEEERARGVVTASSGNHAQGLGYAAKELEVKAKVIVPEMTPQVKLDAIRKYGVELIIEGEEYMVSERLARKIEDEEGMTFVSAYNDIDLIKGQGTVGLEMVEDVPDLDIVLIPVGGGGLASGVASVIKQATSATVIGVQSDTSPVMYECVKKGHIHDIPLRDTYAEGLHGGLEPGSVSFDICMEVIDEWAILTEDDILAAIKFLLHESHMLVEGAGAVGVAALLSDPERYRGKRVGVVISGGNLGMKTLKKVV